MLISTEPVDGALSAEGQLSLLCNDVTFLACFSSVWMVEIHDTCFSLKLHTKEWSLISIANCLAGFY